MKQSSNTITVTIYGNRGEHVVDLPAHWVICHRCEGCATDRGAGVECDGGGFTSSEWAEQDDDFKEGYLAGRYDRPCPHCRGLGRVQVVDREHLGNRWLKKLYREYVRQERDSRAIDQMQAAERRMGA
jgi:hypothetical protein